MGNKSSQTSGVTRCTVYEREFVTDFIHEDYQYVTEIFVPDRKIIIRCICKETNKFLVLDAENAATKPIPVNPWSGRVGRVQKVREEDVPNRFIHAAMKQKEAAAELFEAAAGIRDLLCV